MFSNLVYLRDHLITITCLCIMYVFFIPCNLMYVIIIIMFNFISHRAEILVSMVFGVRADINQISKVSPQYCFLGTQQGSTFLIIVVVPNSADFRTCSILISIPRLLIYFSNFVVIAPDVPSCISQSFLILYHTLALSTSTISGLLASIM